MNKEKLLEERITYLEESNDRRKSTILEQRQKINDLEDTVFKVNELNQNLIEENKKLRKIINQAIEYIHKYNSYFIDCYEDKKGDTYSKDVEVIEIIPKDLKKILKGGNINEC